MAKTKISEFSATPGNNTDIDGINIAEGCAPSGINDAIRELMAQLKDFQTGAAGDSFNGPVGTTTAAAGAFTTLSASGAVTLSGGTANGVPYLNGSKVLTTGSALTFDGTTLANINSDGTGFSTQSAASNFSIMRLGTDSVNGYAFFQSGKSGTGTTLPFAWRQDSSELMRLTSTGLGIGTSSPDGTLHVRNAAGTNTTIWGATGVSGSYAYMRLQRNTSDGTFTFGTAQQGYSAIAFATSSSSNEQFAERMRIDTSGNVGIGTSSPSYKLDVVDTGGNLFRFTRTTEQLGAYVSAGNVYFGTLSNNPLLLMTSGTTKATLDSSGNLGLGVTPSAWGSDFKALQVNDTGASLWSYRSGATSNEYLYLSNNSYNNNTNDIYIRNGAAVQYRQLDGTHAWFNAASGTAGNAISFTQAMTLDASGNLGIGATSPGSRLDVRTVSSAPLIRVTTNADASGSAQGGLQWFETNSGAVSASITGIRGGGAFNQTSLIFSTADGGANTERARIDSSGNLLVGTTSSIATARMALAASASTNGFCVRAGDTANLNFIGRNAADANTFLVYGNGNVQNTNNSYGAISDAKLKENVTDATPKLEKLNQVRIVNFNMIGDEQKQIGVIAQELEQIFPGMVEEAPDRDAEGNDLGTTTKSVKYSVFVPMLIKAMQEQQAIINQLTARIEALEQA